MYVYIIIDEAWAAQHTLTFDCRGKSVWWSHSSSTNRLENTQDILGELEQHACQSLRVPLQSLVE